MQDENYTKVNINVLQRYVELFIAEQDRNVKSLQRLYEIMALELGQKKEFSEDMVNLC